MTGSPDAGVEPTLLHAFFARTRSRFPDGVALEIPPSATRPLRTRVSYADLGERADGLAAQIRPRVRRDEVVVLLLERPTVALFAAELAVLAAGAAYTVIEPGLPDAAASAILDDARPPLVLATEATRPRARALGIADDHLLLLTADGRPIGAHALRAGPLPPEPLASDLAYLIYTSGTTGRPKGVMIEHRSIANLVAADRAAFGLSAADRIGQGSSHAYDSSVEETWLAWGCGGTLVVLDDETVRLGPDLVPWLRAERITVFCPPPTLLRSTGTEDMAEALPELRLLYVGGEALTPDVAARFARGRRLENGYGPTECTVTVVRGTILPGAPITIGRPVPGHRAYLLDERLEEVPEGTPGELCIAGIGLARGYRNLPDATAEKFIEHPRHGRLYRTGDVARWTSDGELEYLGRLDAQVKIRGHRIELEAVEAALASHQGVLAAACRVQGEGSDLALAAHVVPKDRSSPPDFEALRRFLAERLPAAAVPGLFGIAETLPRTVGGKLDRRRLPDLARRRGTAARSPAPAETEIEGAILAAFVAELGGVDDIGVEDDFFDFGGNSLRAAKLISTLRGDPRTAGLAVRDVYEARTVRGLSARAMSRAPLAAGSLLAPPGRHRGRRPVLVSVLQCLWLVGEVVAVAAFTWALVLLAGFVAKRTGVAGLVVAAVLGSLLSAALAWPFTVALAVLAKRLLIGRYVPGSVPVFSLGWLRNWIVGRVVRLVPWGRIQGTELQCAALRALGAKIGRDVHLHRGVDLLQGGWDLLTIGDGASIAEDAALQTVVLADGQLVFGRVDLGERSVVSVRATVEAGAAVLDDAVVRPLAVVAAGTVIPKGALADGIPAQAIGAAPPALEATAPTGRLSPRSFAVVALLARAFAHAVIGVPALVIALALAHLLRVDGEGIASWLEAPDPSPRLLIVLSLAAAAAVPLGVLAEALFLRLLGPVRPGIVPRASFAYLRVVLKSELLESAGRWLSGTVFWPAWLRLAGMKVGRNCEISTIIDVVPELVSIGSETFFADGIYLGAPEIRAGAVRLAPVVLGARSFVGNHAVIPGGTALGDEILLGVATVADGTRMASGRSYFGHPPFELPQREIVVVDRRLTYDPGALQVATRIFWELLRAALPAATTLLAALWVVVARNVEAAGHGAAFNVVGAAAATVVVAALGAAFVVALKWGLLGRVRPGRHALWSCWASRWDFLYVAWGVLARPFLAALDGTLLLAAYLRLTGMRIGRRVVLGPGFTQVVDPDMITIEDDATVDVHFQAHTFEDRVLKIDRVRIGAGATVHHGTVMLYDAEIGAEATVLAHGVVMKGEHLPPGRVYAGAPVTDCGPRARQS